MAAINFPDSPSNGDTHVVGNVTYVYDNAKAKWNGAGQTPNDRLTEGSNSLEINAGNDLVWTGGDVGIGDTAPNNNYGKNLSVHSTATNGARLKISDGTTGKGNLDGLDIISTGGVAYFINRETDDMSFSTGGGEALRIKSDGKVGIGEDSPADRLVVQKTNASGDVGVRIKNDTLTDGDATNPTTASLYLNTSTGDFNTFYIQARRSDNNTHFGYADPRDANHTPNLVITSDGTILAGGQTASYDGGFVNLELRTDSNTTGGSMTLVNNTASQAGATCQIDCYQNFRSSGRIIFGRENANNWQAAAAGAASFLSFHTNNAGTEAERLRITSDGQLQATGAADVRLTLGSGGTVGTNDSVHIRADGANLKFMAASGGTTVFETNGTETLRISADGTTKTSWFSCATTGKTVNASDTAVLTINGFNPSFVQVYIKANFGANGALQAHFDYELITCDAQGTGGTTAIRQSLNESVGSFQISTSDFAVTKSGQNITITYTNQNAGQNQISFYVKGLFNSLSVA